jgi:hypothetical protein
MSSKLNFSKSSLSNSFSNYVVTNTFTFVLFGFLATLSCMMSIFGGSLLGLFRFCSCLLWALIIFRPIWSIACCRYRAERSHHVSWGRAFEGYGFQRGGILLVSDRRWIVSNFQILIILSFFLTYWTIRQIEGSIVSEVLKLRRKFGKLYLLVLLLNGSKRFTSYKFHFIHNYILNFIKWLNFSGY